MTYLRLVMWSFVVVALAASHWKAYVMGKHEEQLAQSKATIAAVQTARTEEKENAQRFQKAQSNQVAKLRIVERDSAGTLSELERLRNALRAKPTGDATIAAAIERTDTLGKLLESCSAEYQSVARAADGHALDVITLRDAWPR